MKCGTSYTLGVDAYDSAGNVSPTASIVVATGACSSSLLGTDVLGTYADYNPPGWSEAFSSVASSSGTLSALRVYVDAQSTAPSLVAGLYSDANGAPGSLLGQGSLTPATGAWNNVPLPPVSVSAGKTYWIALLAPNGTLYYRDTCCTSGTPAFVNSSTTLTALPAAWSGTSTYSAGPISAYGLTGTAASTGGVDAIPPTTPTGLTATTSTQTSISLNWAQSTDNVAVIGYGAYLNGLMAGITATNSFTFTNLSCGTTYTLAVDAADAAGNRSPQATLSASTSACSTSSPVSGASVYVSPTGSDSGSCTSTAPCLTFDRAYHVASAGQVVQVAAGSYPDESLTADPSKTGPGVVTFRPASGAGVSVASIYVGGASYVTFSNLSAGNRITVENQNYSQPGSTNVTFDSVTAKTVRIVGRVSNTTIRGGSYGNTLDSQPQVKKYNLSDPDTSQPYNTVVEDTSFHDFRRSGSTVHTECFQVMNADGLTVRRTRFWNCDGTGDIGLTTYPGTRNVTFENNFIMGGGDTGYGAQISGDVANLIWRNNSSTQSVFFSDSSLGGPYRFVGNYMPFHSSLCGKGAVHSHNVYVGGSCSASDLVVSGLKFVGPLDLHLLAGSEAINAGDPGDFPATDIDGQARTGLPDAGADEAG